MEFKIKSPLRDCPAADMPVWPATPFVVIVAQSDTQTVESPELRMESEVSEFLNGLIFKYKLSPTQTAQIQREAVREIVFLHAKMLSP